MPTADVSRVISSFQTGVPWVPKIAVPVCAEACQAPKTAPSGSAAMTSRPASAASSGPTPIVPPHILICSAVSSTSSEAMYGVHATGRRRSAGSRPMPATSLPSSSARTYGPSCCGQGRKSQPNSSR
nr:hypothetical protein [Streptomyces sp. I6]